MPIFHQPHNSIGNHSYNVYIYESIDYDLHFHKNYELIYVMEGQALCSVSGQCKTLVAGDFAFCLSNELHAIKSVGESKIWIGVFSEDFIHEFKKYQTGKTGADFSFRCEEKLMEYLKNYLLKKELSDVFTIKSCLYAVCSEYLRQITLEESQGTRAELMNRIVDYIEKNYKRPLSLSMLAESLGYEYCYFSKTFNRLFSMNFNDYINIYRFNEACAMLTKTGMSVTDISYESGFQSIRSFNNIFKKLSGVTPRAYRKIMP